MILSDLYTFFKNRRYIKNVFLCSDSSDPEFRVKYSEAIFLTQYEPTVPVLLAYLAVGKPLSQKRLPGTFTVGETTTKKKSKDEWFYVNGICTDQTIARLNAECLNSLLGVPIRVVHNPTFGVIADLAECVFERALDARTPVTAHLFSEVVEALRQNKKVKIICHSQGGIIIASMLRKLRDEKVAVAGNLEIYTFASGTDEEIPIPGVYQEHFANEDDFVARAGIMTTNPKGELFVKSRGIGHLLNRDYLEHFKSGLYCNKKSKLYGYLK